jgi:hypothetical protein
VSATHRIRPEHCADAAHGIDLSLRAARRRAHMARRAVIACAMRVSTDEEHGRCHAELDEAERDTRLLEQLAWRLRGDK